MQIRRLINTGDTSPPAPDITTGTPSQRSLGFQATLTAFTHSMILPIGIITVILVSRLVGPAGKGVLTALLLISTVLPSFGLFGITNGLIFYVGHAPEQRRSYQATVLVFGLALTGSYGLLLWIFRGVLWEWLLSEVPYSEPLALSMVASAVLAVANATACGVILSQREIGKYNLALVLTAVVKFLLVLGTLLIPTTFYLKWLAWAPVAGLTAATIVYFRNCVIICVSAPPSFHLLARMLNFSIKSYWGAVVQKLDHVLARFLVATFLFPADLGCYAVSLLMTQPIILVPTAISPVVMPYASSEHGSDADDKLFALARIALWITAVVALCLAAILRPIIHYALGQSFMPALMPAYLLLPGLLALGHAKILARFMTARGYPTDDSASSVVALVLTAISLWVLLPMFGIVGAAAASTLGYVGYDVSLTFFFRCRTGHSVRRIFVPCRSDLLLIHSVIVRLSKKLFTHASSAPRSCSSSDPDAQYPPDIERDNNEHHR